MQPGNAEIVRGIIAALSRGDVDDVLARMAPDFEWTPLADSPVAGTYQGHEEVRHYVEDWLSTFDMLRLDVEDLTEFGDHVVAVVCGRGRGRRSGVELRNRFCQVWTLRAGTPVRMEEHATREEALAALR